MSRIELFYDAATVSFTEKGIRALRRAFWMHDSNGDGILSSSESAMLLQSCDSADAKICTLDEWLSLCSDRFKSSTFEPILSALQKTGIILNTAEPFTDSELESVAACSPQHGMFLSHAGISFFATMYRPERFPVVDDMWLLTPGCPWREYSGLPTHQISLDAFIEAWKFVATQNRSVVVRYARFWGYKGAAAALFSKGKLRPYRSYEDGLPSTVLVLVVGSPHCGRRSLFRFITATEESVDVDEADLHTKCYVRTKSYFPESASQTGGHPRTVVYMLPSDAEAALYLSDPLFMKQVDVLVYTYDWSDPYSCSFWMQRHSQLQLVPGDATTHLPCIIVATKVDIPPCTQKVEEAIERFCARYRLLWPPVRASVAEGFEETTDTSSLHEFIYCVAETPSLALAPAAITPWRMIRRIVFVAAVGGLVWCGVKRFLKRRNLI